MGITMGQLTRFAVVDKEGNVVNVIELYPEDLYVTWRPPEGCIVMPSDISCSGDKYIDGELFCEREIVVSEDGETKVLSKRFKVLAYEGGRLEVEIEDTS